MTDAGHGEARKKCQWAQYIESGLGAMRIPGNNMREYRIDPKLVTETKINSR